MEILRRISTALAGPVEPDRLAWVRRGFGLLMVVEVLRYLLFGWVDIYFVQPEYHFTYPGFDWVRPLSRMGMMVVFLFMGLSSSALMWGYRVRFAAGIFTLCFGYIFLIDQTYYQNHWVLIGWLGLYYMLVGHERDARRWVGLLLRFQVGVVYAFAGLAKANADWIAGQPMGIWLALRSDWPLIGPLLGWPPSALALSWAGLLFDLAIVPLLCWRKTRRPAFAVAVLFHLGNALLFKIGIFPMLMIVLTTVFLPLSAGKHRVTNDLLPARIWVILVLWVGFHATVPLRHWAIPGPVAWTEEGHRFSWRMKTRSKVGRVTFHALDRGEGKHEVIDPLVELTAHQARKMATRPEMIRQYALHLAKERATTGSGKWAIHADARAKLNHHPAKTLIDPTVDLVQASPSGGGASWIIWED